MIHVTLYKNCIKGGIMYILLLAMFFSFFSYIQSAQSTKLLLGTVSYTGQSNCYYQEQQNTLHEYNLTIFNAVCTQETEQSIRQSLQQLIPDAMIKTNKDKNNLSMHITFNPNYVMLKLEQRETINGQRCFTICVYDKQQIMLLEQMTKKPILQYTLYQNILSVIA